MNFPVAVYYPHSHVWLGMKPFLTLLRQEQEMFDRTGSVAAPNGVHWRGTVLPMRLIPARTWPEYMNESEHRDAVIPRATGRSEYVVFA